MYEMIQMNRRVRVGGSKFDRENNIQAIEYKKFKLFVRMEINGSYGTEPCNILAGLAMDPVLYWQLGRTMNVFCIFVILNENVRCEISLKSISNDLVMT